MLRWEKVDNRGEIYSSGSILAVMFSVIFGAFGLGGMVPHIKAITEGRVAGKLAHETMAHKPVVDPTKGGKKIDRNTMQGKIVFNDVSFTYPTRQELTVLKNFSHEFEAGKTTALVGPSGSGKSTIIQLVERFYQQDKGSITLDGVSLDDLDLSHMRRQIGYIG